MIGVAAGVTVEEFAAAWGGLPSAEPGALRLDLAAAKVYVWEMPGPMAGGVHELLSRQFIAPLVRLPGVKGLVVFGAADAAPTKDQQAVIERGGVRRWDTGLWLLPDPTPRTGSPCREGMSLAPLAEVVAAIERSIPIGVRRQAVGR